MPPVDWSQPGKRHIPDLTAGCGRKVATSRRSRSARIVTDSGREHTMRSAGASLNGGARSTLTPWCAG